MLKPLTVWKTCSKKFVLKNINVSKRLELYFKFDFDLDHNNDRKRKT